MKVLTVTEPFATLIIWLFKMIETRSWYSNYRGEVGIHAAKGFPNWAKDLCNKEPFSSTLQKCGISSHKDFKLGFLIGKAEIKDWKEIIPCIPENTLQEILYEQNSVIKPPPEPEYSFGDYTAGRYGILLKNNTRLIDPIEIKGALSLWDFNAVYKKQYGKAFEGEMKWIK